MNTTPNRPTEAPSRRRQWAHALVANHRLAAPVATKTTTASTTRDHALRQVGR